MKSRSATRILRWHRALSLANLWAWTPPKLAQEAHTLTHYSDHVEPAFNPASPDALLGRRLLGSGAIRPDGVTTLEATRSSARTKPDFENCYKTVNVTCSETVRKASYHVGCDSRMITVWVFNDDQIRHCQQ